MLRMNSVLLLLSLVVAAGCTNETAEPPAAPPADGANQTEGSHDHGDSGHADHGHDDHSHADHDHAADHKEMPAAPSEPAPEPASVSQPEPAPAPAETPAPAPAPETTDSPSAAAPGEAQAAIEALAASFSKGQAGVVWDALPPAWQNDVTEIVQGVGSGMDPMVWGQITGLVGKIHGIVDSKAEFIVGSPMVAQSGNADMVAEALPHVAGLLGTILEVADLEKMKSFDGAAFFGGPASTLLTQMDGLAALSPEAGRLADITQAKFETLKEEGDTATLRVTPPKEGAEVEELEMVRIDGHWVPADLAKDWDSNIAQAKEQLKTLPETSKQAGQQVMMVAGMIGGNLAPLEAAETQEQFDTALMNIQAMLGPMVGGMMQQMGGAGMAPAPTPAAPTEEPAETPAE